MIDPEVGYQNGIVIYLDRYYVVSCFGEREVSYFINKVYLMQRVLGFKFPLQNLLRGFHVGSESDAQLVFPWLYIG